MKPFILMTTGRSGSTSLMDSLAKHHDIAVPSKQIKCIDNEILHPSLVKKYLPFYQKFSQLPIKNDISLINAFFQANATSPYAGFKSMPDRHPNLQSLIDTPSIQVITLIRRDLASTIASFIIAIDKKTWRRHGEVQNHSFNFDDRYKDRAIGHLNYILSSQEALKQFPNAIHLYYEDLCNINYKNERLNHFFNRNIQINNPKKPISGESYVKNWDEFKVFIKNNLNDMRPS